MYSFKVNLVNNKVSILLLIHLTEKYEAGRYEFFLVITFFLERRFSYLQKKMFA